MSLCSYYPDAGARTRSGLGRRHLDVGHFVLFSRNPGFIQVRNVVQRYIQSSPIQSSLIQNISRVSSSSNSETREKSGDISSRRRFCQMAIISFDFDDRDMHEKRASARARVVVGKNLSQRVSPYASSMLTYGLCG